MMAAEPPAQGWKQILGTLVEHGIFTNGIDTEKIWHLTSYNDDFTIAADSFAVVSVFKTARRRQVEERTRGISAKRTRIRRVPANGYRY